MALQQKIVHSPSMEEAIIVAIVTAIAGILASAIAFYQTRAKEREALWQSQKLGLYKRFMTALSGIVGDTPTTPEKIAFATASNDIFLVGSPGVLVALRNYLDETAESNANKAEDRHDQLLTALIFAIREDLGRKPNRPNEPFELKLWSGKPRLLPDDTKK